MHITSPSDPNENLNIIEVDIRQRWKQLETISEVSLRLVGIDSISQYSSTWTICISLQNVFMASTILVTEGNIPKIASECKQSNQSPFPVFAPKKSSSVLVLHFFETE
jgi:hypothetical protein